MTKTKKQDYIASLQKKLDIKNVNAVPKVEKVIVSLGIGSLVTRKGLKSYEELEQNLKIITGQKPRIIKSKQAISNFKLRIGMPVMLQCTLRKKRAVDFLDRLNKIVLPRVRDFKGLKTKSFDPNANINIGLKSYDIFPELDLDNINIPMGIQINIVTTTNDKKASQELLKELGFIIAE